MKDITDKEILLKQFDCAKTELHYLDSNYVKTVLLYMALIGAYIGNFESFTGGSCFVKYGASFAIFILSLFVCGIVIRTRKNYDEQYEIISKIEDKLDMIKVEIKRNKIQSIRTSSYFMLVILVLSTLAIFLTLS